MHDQSVYIEESINAESKPKFKHLIKLWIFVFSSAKTMSLVFLGLMILLSLLRPVAALVWGKYIDLATSHLPGGELLPLALLLSLYFLINFLIGILLRYTEHWEDIERLDIVQANRFQELVNSRVLRKLSHIDPEYWEVPKVNDLADRTFQFISDRWGGLNRGVMVQGYFVLAKVVSVLSIAASLYIFNPWLCLIVLLAPLPSLYTLLFSEKLRFKFVKENSQLLRRANYFQNVLLRNGAKEVKTMGLFDFFYTKWKTIMDEYTIKEKRLYRNQTMINMLNGIITSSANIGANILAISLMAKGEISLGALGASMALISTLLGDTSTLIGSVATFLSKKNEAALFHDLMDLEERQGKLECDAMESIETLNLQYRYPLSERYVVDDVSLSITKGEKIALVGENGAGKTTFVKLITGILSPSNGRLLINNKDEKILNLESRFAKMSTVSQTPPKYHTFTVAENVFLGDTLLPRDDYEIGQALAFSGLDNMSQETLLGKEIGGTELSGGEWQKLAVARAVYRNRDFIILDEPTSNLDPLAETEIFEKYMDLANDKTVVFVTHRISVAALAERIIVFDDGKIIEEGDHSELLAKGGKYAALYKEQAQWYDR